MSALTFFVLNCFFLEKLIHIEGLKTGHFPRLKAGVKFFFYPYFDKKKIAFILRPVFSN